MNKKAFIVYIILNLTCSIWAIDQNNKKPKIVTLMQVRNEENIIEQCLRAITLYTDAIIVLDDASTDKTLSIVQFLSKELPIEKIICCEISSRENGNESDNAQMLLSAGREIYGTHFIILDADEMFTANCMQNNYLRNKILSLKPGDSITMCLINLWRSINYYRHDNSVWTWNYKKIIFCDDKKCSHNPQWLHAPRVPANLVGKSYTIPGYEYGFLHFQFVNWHNLLVKQAWYRCLERIRDPKKPAQAINVRYAPSKDETNLGTRPAPSIWFEGYEFFDPTIYDKEINWRKEQVINWFKRYGKNYFKDLDIWDVDWKDTEK
jgi:glycosyltransferase involved in cell wall biosynthesis